jgi:hypothetical protein
MTKKSSVVMMIASVIIYLFFSSNISAERKILDENGVWNGLVNVNPDPYGEPWISGDMGPVSPEEQAAWDALPAFELSPQLRGRSLPKTVDHSLDSAFRPIFNQSGGSCGQASGTAYHFTFERNMTLGLKGSDVKNQCAPGFPWNMVNAGKDQGSIPGQGYAIEQAMGCIRVPDFNNNMYGGAYLNFFWPTGFQAYYNANDCHVVSQKTFKTSDVALMKNWFYDKGTGTGKNGGCITFASSVSWTNITTIPSGPHQGDKVAATLAAGTAHCMTLTGYTEELSYDVNGDSRITTDVDITGDGIVDYRDRETGAYQNVNSWGASFNNKGKVWVMCSGFGGNLLTGITVAPFKTLLMVKAQITSSVRNGILINTGYSADVNATAPTAIKGYGAAFKKAGGANPMIGIGQSATIEIGLDVSDFVAKLPEGAGKIFLQISGAGTVNSMSVMDYTGGSVKETAGPQNVTIDATATNIGVAVKVTPTSITKPNSFAVVKTKPVSVVRVGNEYALVLPSAEKTYLISIRDLMGKELDRFSTGGKKQVKFGANLPSGMYVVTIMAPEGSITEKLNIIR